MDEFDLPDLLSEGAPAAGPEVLGQIVRRHGRRRVRRARIAASIAVVAALAGAGAGIGLSRPPHHTLAAASGFGQQRSADKVPAGLHWAKAAGGRPAAAAGPGVFGWLGDNSISASSASANSGRAPSASPPAALVAPVPARYVPAVCTRMGCGPFYPAESLTRLFERTVDGVTIEAQLGQYGLPAGKSPPEMPFSGTAGTGRGGSGSATQAARASASRPVRVALPCLSPTELIVTVRRGGSGATLAVPGAASSRPFSVLASAEVDLDGREVVVAVTHTSVAARRVVAEFPGGGQDAMAPVDGWSVLLHRPDNPQAAGAAGAVTLEAASAPGSTLEEVKLPATGWLATPVVGTCRYWVVPPLPITSPPVNSTPQSSPGGSPTTGKSG